MNLLGAGNKPAFFSKRLVSCSCLGEHEAGLLNVVMLQTSFYLPRGWLYLSLLVEITLGVLADADPHQRLRRPPSSVS